MLSTNRLGSLENIENAGSKTISEQDRMGLLGDLVRTTFIDNAAPLSLIDSRIRSCLSSEAEQLTQISTYLLNLGGKRVRPLLALLTNQLFKQPEPSQSLIDTAAGIELIHMATLLHDDIIDQSPLRRSQTSAYSEFGLPSTLLTGDFLLVRAFGMCAKLDDFIVEETEKACVALTEGEITEGTLYDNGEKTLDEYRIVVEKKTAALFSLASITGAHLAGATPEEIEHLRNFGTRTGVAFQMIDDILDITADETLLGKPAGTDLKQRTPSLPNLLWIQNEPTKAREFFKQAQSPEKVKEITSYLATSSIIDEAKQIATETARNATECLNKISRNRIEPQVKEQLLALLEYTLERCL